MRPLGRCNKERLREIGRPSWSNQGVLLKTERAQAAEESSLPIVALALFWIVVTPLWVAAFLLAALPTLAFPVMVFVEVSCLLIGSRVLWPHETDPLSKE